MPIDNGALQYARDQLSLVEPVTVKRLFGGAGFYARGYFFGLFDDDTLYFKTDDSNRADYLAAGSPPFAPWGEDGAKLEYFEVPDLVLDNLSKLQIWMEKSIAVAIRAKESRQMRSRKGRKADATEVKVGRESKPCQAKSDRGSDGKAPMRSRDTGKKGAPKKTKRNSR